MGRALTRDPDGAEISVETGIGRVCKVEITDGKRNASVEIDAEHLRQYPVKCWADTHDAVMMGVVRAGLEKGTRLNYRIVVKRKATVDPTRPFSELTKHDKIRSLEELVPAPPLAVDSGSPASNPPPDAQTAAPGPQNRQSGQSANGRGPRVEEAKPWEDRNSDGSLNLGSYAVQASVGMVDKAHSLLLARRDDGVPPPLTKVNALARLLLGAADHAQATVRADHHVDRMDPSHSRARAMVHTALEAEPVPWGGTEEERQAWVIRLSTRAAELLALAAQLVP